MAYYPTLCTVLVLVIIILAICCQQLWSQLKLTQNKIEKLLLFEAIIQQTNAAVVITNTEINPPGPKILFVNSAFTKLTGYTTEEIIGKNPRILQGLRTDRNVLNQLRQKLEQGDTFVGEAINYTKNGTEFYMEWEVTPLKNKSQEITHFLAIQRNITHRKQAEQSWQQTITHLEDLNLLKDDFLSTISHELRTPLTNMKMALQMLKVTVLPEVKNGKTTFDLNANKIAQYLRILEGECHRETALINDLLDLQRLEAQRWSSRPETIETQIWLPTLIRPFEQRIRERQQVLQVNIAEDIPVLFSDRSSLERILCELINNACKYTPPGEKIVVTASTRSKNLRLQVANSGVDISAMELTKIFDKFYRIPQVDRWQEGGTGLGLTLVKKIVESLNGTLEVESAKNLISFTVELPLVSFCSIKVIP